VKLFHFSKILECLFLTIRRCRWLSIRFNETAFYRCLYICAEKNCVMVTTFFTCFIDKNRPLTSLITGYGSVNKIDNSNVHRLFFPVCSLIVISSFQEWANAMARRPSSVRPSVCKLLRKSLLLADKWPDRHRTFTRWTPGQRASRVCSRSRSSQRSRDTRTLLDSWNELLLHSISLTVWFWYIVINWHGVMSYLFCISNSKGVIQAGILSQFLF